MTEVKWVIDECQAKTIFNSPEYIIQNLIWKLSLIKTKKSFNILCHLIAQTNKPRKCCVVPPVPFKYNPLPTYPTLSSMKFPAVTYVVKISIKCEETKKTRFCIHTYAKDKIGTPPVMVNLGYDSHTNKTSFFEELKHKLDNNSNKQFTFLINIKILRIRLKNNMISYQSKFQLSNYSQYVSCNIDDNLFSRIAETTSSKQECVVTERCWSGIWQLKFHKCNSNKSNDKKFLNICYYIQLRKLPCNVSCLKIMIKGKTYYVSYKTDCILIGQKQIFKDTNMSFAIHVLGQYESNDIAAISNCKWIDTSNTDNVTKTIVFGYIMSFNIPYDIYSVCLLYVGQIDFKKNYGCYELILDKQTLLKVLRKEKKQILTHIVFIAGFLWQIEVSSSKHNVKLRLIPYEWPEQFISTIAVSMESRNKTKKVVINILCSDDRVWYENLILDSILDFKKLSNDIVIKIRIDILRINQNVIQGYINSVKCLYQAPLNIYKEKQILIWHVDAIYVKKMQNCANANGFMSNTSDDGMWSLCYYPKKFIIALQLVCLPSDISELEVECTFFCNKQKLNNDPIIKNITYKKYVIELVTSTDINCITDLIYSAEINILRKYDTNHKDLTLKNVEKEWLMQPAFTNIAYTKIIVLDFIHKMQEIIYNIRGNSKYYEITPMIKRICLSYGSCLFNPYCGQYKFNIDIDTTSNMLYGSNVFEIAKFQWKIHVQSDVKTKTLSVFHPLLLLPSCWELVIIAVTVEICETCSENTSIIHYNKYNKYQEYRSVLIDVSYLNLSKLTLITTINVLKTGTINNPILYQIPLTRNDYPKAYRLEWCINDKLIKQMKSSVNQQSFADSKSEGAMWIIQCYPNGINSYPINRNKEFTLTLQLKLFPSDTSKLHVYYTFYCAQLQINDTNMSTFILSLYEENITYGLCT
eukprot:492395_1